MSADNTRVNQWIYGTLNDDNILNTQLGLGHRIYTDMAPQSPTQPVSPLPIVIIAYLGGADKIRSKTARFTNALYLIRAIKDGSSYDPLEAIADRIDELLRVPDVGTLVRDVRIATCNREQPHQRKDAENGRPTVYLGGFYRVQFQPADF